MIVWNEDIHFPFEIFAGDILFIGGKNHPPTSGLNFEHVVLAAESQRIESAQDFLNLPVYGLPESVSRYLPGIETATGQRWLGVTSEGVIGSDETVWNLAGRVSGVTKDDADELSWNLAQRIGSFDCSYAALFRVDGALVGPLRTNCLGFVCSIFEFMGWNILQRSFPVYRSPYEYSKGLRNYPSPGHLARVLHLRRPRLPWGTRNRRLARKYATVAFTIAAVRRQGSNPSTPN